MIAEPILSHLLNFAHPTTNILILTATSILVAQLSNANQLPLLEILKAFFHFSF